MTTKQAKAENITITKIDQGQIDFCVLGRTPLITHAMSQKTRLMLLIPPPKKNAAAKASTLKHDPIQEFKDSMYYARHRDNPTRVIMPAVSFKNSLRSVAVDLPGSTKAQVGRLTYVVGDQVSIYGIPELKMDVVRMADLKRTPDVRTRAIFPKWAAQISVRFTKPMMNKQAVINLLAAAGIMQGLGEWRPERGQGDYGQYELVAPDDAEFQWLLENGGRDAQIEAIKNPVCYDDETEALLSLFDAEVKRRGFDGLRAVS